MGNHGAASARARAGTVSTRAIQPADGNPVTSRRRRTLSNWPVSRRLFAVIVMALVMGLVFGGLRVADAESSAAQFGRVSQLANLGEQVTVLVQDLQDERDATVGVISGVSKSVLPPLWNKTDATVAQVRTLAAGIGGGFPANIQTEVATVLADISPASISTLHHTIDTSQDALAVIANYTAPVSDMITLNDQIEQGTSDATLASDVRTLNALSLAKEQASQQRALLYGTLDLMFFGDGILQAMTTAYSEELLNEASFLAVATPQQKAAYSAAVSGPGVNEAETIEDFAFANPGPDAAGDNPLSGITNLDKNIGMTRWPGLWYQSQSDKINGMQSVELGIANDIVARAETLQHGAQRSALISAIITAVVLLLVLIAASLVARSLVLPLRRLRAGALDIASVQLPERVRELSEAPDPAQNLHVAPIDVLTEDEIGQVARAFDQVHAEAVRLAGNEAMLRTSFNAMFVNLSRRSQSLIERLARMIDSLEQNEDDPDRLSSLFSMDHLVTRMRRNSENLLLLAGHEGARKWSEPVTLADVARAATSEIEQYSRVVLNIQPGVAVIGQAVSDVVHLLAELIENATLFSPKDTQVMVTAQELSSGGVLIEITDKGIGVSEARLAEMNWRLDNTPAMDVSVSRHMGLFAVARLAERHRVRVRLRPASPQGLSALVWLPDSVIERTGRGFAVSGGGWSRPFAEQPPGLAGQPGLPGRRTPGQASLGTRAAVEGRRTALADGPVPVGANLDEAEPIHEATSNWFRSRRISATGVGTGNAVRPGAATGGWAAPGQPGGSAPYGADPWAQGRHAAEIIADPIRGDQTAAGLPVRVPKANLIPGSAGGLGGPGGGLPADGPGGAPLQPPLPQRSPDLARSRLSGFQRGARRAEGRRPSAEEGADS
jgi:signal transduction histidine kinase